MGGVGKDYVRTVEPVNHYLEPREAWATVMLAHPGKIPLVAVDAAVDAARKPLLYRIKLLERELKALGKGKS